MSTLTSKIYRSKLGHLGHLFAISFLISIKIVTGWKCFNRYSGTGKIHFHYFEKIRAYFDVINGHDDDDDDNNNNNNYNVIVLNLS